MRIIAIGLGGAGCRIVDSLYSTDRRSSKVACVQALAVDVAEDLLKGLKSLPDSNKLFYPPSEPGLSGTRTAPESSATIDIAEIIGRIHNFETAENDAILICIGLGGSMADIAPHIITGLRSSVTEPVFGLVTLPCLAEGERRSARAADQIDVLSSLLDGMILFDNETWYKKTKAHRSTLKTRDTGLIHRLGLAKAEPEMTGEEATYQLINQAIVRRISLILKAGEFKADGGIDMAEVVLDSGEVLNTLKGMGFITIGYAVERLPSNPLAFLAQLRPQGVFDEENKKRASRIVDLAKQAIYHEISTPCDMTSAHKALVLIAGPSHELSMKGFMTVRKWIDRSIAGLEMRSGDYPVMNTKNVAIIVVLSGLENIPRITELREIRAQHRAWPERRVSGDSGLSAGTLGESPSEPGSGPIRDEMIVLPAKMSKKAAPSRSGPIGTAAAIHESRQHHPGEGRPQTRETISRVPLQEQPAEPVPEKILRRTADSDSPVHKPSRQRIVMAENEISYIPASSDQPIIRTPDTHPVHTSSIHKTSNTSQEKAHLHSGAPLSQEKDAARQRIELELQKQRLKAMAGKAKATDGGTVAPQIPAAGEKLHKRVTVRPKPLHEEPVHPAEHLPEPERKTIIISKRKVTTRSEERSLEDKSLQESTGLQKNQRSDSPDTEEPVEPGEDRSVEVRDMPFRAKDHVFQGREVQSPKVSATKDSPLLHTSLRQKKGIPAGPDEQVMDEKVSDHGGPESAEPHHDRKRKKPEDLSWI